MPCSRPITPASKEWDIDHRPARAARPISPRSTVEAHAPDHDAPVDLWQPLCAAADRDPHEQRGDVVRPQARPPEFAGAGKRALTNMCPLVGARDGRARFGVGASAGGASSPRSCRWHIHHRFRDDPRGGRAPSAHRCQRREAASRSTGASPKQSASASPPDRPRPWSSTRCGHRASPARTSCCAAKTASITASPNVMSPWSAAVAEPGKEA